MVALPAALDIPPVKRAMEVLTDLSQDTQQRETYKARLRARRDPESDLRSARAEALEEGRSEGILIGQVQFCQRKLGLAVATEAELLALGTEGLAALADELDRRLPKQAGSGFPPA